MSKMGIGNLSSSENHAKQGVEVFDKVAGGLLYRQMDHENHRKIIENISLMRFSCSFYGKFMKDVLNNSVGLFCFIWD